SAQLLSRHRDLNLVSDSGSQGLAAPAGEASGQATQRMDLMIIDCHCHAGKGDKMTAPWNTDAPLGAYLRRARAAGIEKTIVLAPLHGNYQLANLQVARVVARYPGQLIGFAFVHSKRDAGRIFQMVKHAVTRWGFRGMKVHGFDGMPTREVCETARAFRLPV